MKDKTKKLLLAMLLLVMTSTTAFADVVTGSCGENATYSYDTDTGIITIEGNGKMSDYDYGWLYGAPKSVTNAPWRDYYNSISKVVIGEGITYIGNSSFYGCISLTNIDLSETVTNIGDRAFQYCYNLASLYIPKNLESYGSYTFCYCQSITSITVDEENLYFDSREDCNAIIRKRDNSLILGCSNTVIPSSVSSIYDRAFQDCINLNSMIIPENIRSIGYQAFSGCIGLSSLRVDEANPYLDSRDDCNAVIKTSTNELIVGTPYTVIPNSVTRIGDYAFASCDLSTISIPEGVTSIGSWSFAWNNLKSINLPSRLKTIESYAFYNCRSLESINIPNYVTSIGSQTFSFCYNLKTATIGKYVNSIGQDAFYYCKNLTELILLPSTPPEVEEDYYPNDLFDRVSLIVPRKYIDRYKEDDYWGQFKDIRHSTVLTVAPVKTEMLVGETLKLEVERSADIENQPVTWSSSNSSIAEVNDGNVTALSEGIAEITASCDGMTATCEVSVVSKKSNEIITGNCGDNVTYSLDTDSWVLTIEGSGDMSSYNSQNKEGKYVTTAPWSEYYNQIKELYVKEGVTNIGHYAFRGCSGITTISIPATVKNIGAYAFDGCSKIGSVVVPTSVSSLSQHAFSNCTSLTSVTLHDRFNAMGWWVFQGCSSLVNPILNSQFFIYMPESYVGSYTVPHKLVFVDYAFQDSKGLTSVIISDEQEKITGSAFMYAPSLKSITIGRSVSEIGRTAFWHIPNLEKLILLPTTPPSINEEAFTSEVYNKVKLIVPSEVYNAYKQHEVWGNFSSIEYDPVFKIYVDDAEMSIGDVLQVQVQRTQNIENETISWSSNNNDVATVDTCGLVTAKAEGLAEITAYCGGLTATCKITVFRKKRDEIVYGYCDDFVGGGIGNGTNKPIKCAIRIPASALQSYKDCSITKIDVGVSKDVTELVPVISTGGEENYVAQAAIKGYTGWNEIELDNPYVIGSQDLYVGYECVGTYAAAESNIYSQNGSYIFQNGGWSDYSAQEWGSFCIRIHIKGYDLPMDVALLTDKTVECALGESLIVTPSVQNLSPEIVESLTFNCYIDDVFEGSHEVSANIGKGKIEDVPFAITSPSTSGMYNVKIQVEYINGKKDDNASNNTVTIPLTILGKKYDRRVVMEEITGTWCGYCVRGYHAMKTMAERYPNNFIGIAIHGSDEMSGAENYSSIISMLGGSYPSSIANRNSKYKLNASLDEMETAVLAMKDNAIADINAEVEVLDADTTEVKIKTNVEFGLDVTDTFRIAYVVVENGVGPYVQTSYYSGSNTDLGGLENVGSYISLMFNDVARGIYSGFNGVRGSVPSTIFGGEVYSYDYDMLLPVNIDNKANVEVVAMLINQNSGEIVNAYKCKLKDGSNNISGINDDNKEASMIYNINGVRLEAPQRGLNIIRMNNGETKKVMVK